MTVDHELLRFSNVPFTRLLFFWFPSSSNRDTFIWACCFKAPEPDRWPRSTLDVNKSISVINYQYEVMGIFWFSEVGRGQRSNNSPSGWDASAWPFPLWLGIDFPGSRQVSASRQDVDVSHWAGPGWATENLQRRKAGACLVAECKPVRSCLWFVYLKLDVLKCSAHVCMIVHSYWWDYFTILALWLKKGFGLRHS